ncbi:MAG: UDP-N-acetylmuramoyl-tripeptide--D-alanyl-D-alanine ligase [Reyranellaceae bacterium]
MSAETLWTAPEAAAATGGRLNGNPDWRATGASIDSRTLQKGDLFIALHGANDGHDYVESALDKGAVAAIVDRVPPRVGADKPLLGVDDTQAALEALGKAGRARSQARFVAVTGSVGKTSTKEALRHVLSAQAPTSASAASYNNHIGVPLTLARVPRGARFAVIEIGTNHPGEIAPLSRQAQPHVCIVTTIGAVHLENFGTVDEIAREKAAIMAGMQGGTAVFNRDNGYFARLVELAGEYGVKQVVGFGRHPEAEMRLIDSTGGTEGSDVRARYRGRDLVYRVGAAGEHWVINSLAVLAASDALGADIEQAARSLATVAAIAGRGQQHKVRLPGGVLHLIDESYNASPVAMRAAFAVLGAIAPAPGGRRIAILGDMRELGPDAPALHAGLAGPLQEAGIDLLLSCGPLMRGLHQALPQQLRGPHEESSDRLVPHLAAILRPGDVVTVKGSLGSKMKPIVEAILAMGSAAGGRH